MKVLHIDTRFQPPLGQPLMNFGRGPNIPTAIRRPEDPLQANFSILVADASPGDWTVVVMQDRLTKNLRSFPDGESTAVDVLPVPSHLDSQAALIGATGWIGWNDPDTRPGDLGLEAGERVQFSLATPGGGRHLIACLDVVSELPEEKPEGKVIGGHVVPGVRKVTRGSIDQLIEAHSLLGSVITEINESNE